MNQDEKKAAAAQSSLQYLDSGSIVGVGTGSTVNFFIDALTDVRNKIAGAVSSSEASTKRLRDHGIDVVNLAEAGTLDLYVDGADEANNHLQLIKGGGGALTREKIVAAASRKFVCIMDDSKLVDVLGDFPLPVEVIPMARSLVAQKFVSMGGQPIWRENFVTDNGNEIPNKVRKPESFMMTPLKCLTGLRKRRSSGPRELSDSFRQIRLAMILRYTPMRSARK